MVRTIVFNALRLKISTLSTDNVDCLGTQSIDPQREAVLDPGRIEHQGPRDQWWEAANMHGAIVDSQWWPWNRGSKSVSITFTALLILCQSNFHDCIPVNDYFANRLRQWFDDVWLKTEESCVTVAANYESNSKNTCDDTQIHQIAHPEPTSPELATYTPIDHVLERVSDHSIISELPNEPHLIQLDFCWNWFDNI